MPCSCVYSLEREGEGERERGGLASTCCTPPSVSNPLVRRFQSLSMSTVPECSHGDECPWHKRGRCLFKHCALPPVGLTGGEVPVEQQLRDLRRALQRLAAAVMWRDGVPMPQVVKGALDATVPQIMEELQERISERMHERVVDPRDLSLHHDRRIDNFVDVVNLRELGVLGLVVDGRS